MDNYNHLPKDVKRTLSGKLGSYFNKLNFRELGVPESSTEMYWELLDYFAKHHQDRWVDNVAKRWLSSGDGKEWLLEKCEGLWGKWNKIKDEDGVSLTYNERYGRTSNN